jgi:hypothetical protein
LPTACSEFSVEVLRQLRRLSPPARWPEGCAPRSRRGRESCRSRVSRWVRSRHLVLQGAAGGAQPGGEEPSVHGDHFAPVPDGLVFQRAPELTSRRVADGSGEPEVFDHVAHGQVLAGFPWSMRRMTQARPPRHCSTAARAQPARRAPGEVDDCGQGGGSKFQTPSPPHGMDQPSSSADAVTTVSGTWWPRACSM